MSQGIRKYLSKHRKAGLGGLTFLWLLAMSVSSPAQDSVICKRGANAKYQRQLEPTTSAPSDVVSLTRTVLKVFAYSSDLIRIQPAAVPNAEVCLAEEGPPYRILFSPTFFSTIDKDKPEGWAKIAILAHEVGHIVHQDFIKADFGTNQQIELSADEFAGEFMAKYGIELDRALEAYNLDIMKLGGNGNTSYPPIDQRRSAAERGWRAAHDPNLVWNADDPALGHNYGQSIAKVWVSSAQESASGGYMSFGPYVKLQPGTYRVSFLYRCKKEVSTPWPNAITFQVSAFDPTTGGQDTNSSTDIPLTSCNNLVTVASWIFNVSDIGAKSNTFEYRVFSYKNAEIRLREIRVERILTF